MAESRFYYPITVHQGAASGGIDTPFVCSIPLNQILKGSAVILSVDEGTAPQGLYIWDDRRWRYALPQLFVSIGIIDGYTIDVFWDQNGPVAVPDDSRVFRNGIEVVPPVIAGEPGAVYVIMTPVAGAGSGTVTSVNNQLPDATGNVTINIDDIPNLSTTLASFVKSVNHVLPDATGDITLVASDVGAVGLSLVGQPNGVPSLDSNGWVPMSQLPPGIIGGLQYQGTYDAATNTPPLPAPAPANKGFYWVVSVAGTQQGMALRVGDWVVSNGTSYDKIDNQEGRVLSVNGALPDPADGNVVVPFATTTVAGTVYVPTTGGLLIGADGALTVNQSAVGAWTPSETIWVDYNGDAVTGTGKQNNPYKTIGEAVDNALPNAVIMISPGSYAENLVLGSKPLYIKGWGNVGNYARTVITGNMVVGGTSQIRVQNLGISYNGTQPCLTINQVGTTSGFKFENLVINANNTQTAILTNAAGGTWTGSAYFVSLYVNAGKIDCATGTGYQASTDNLATTAAFTGIPGTSGLNCVASSPTSIIVGTSVGVARATSQNLLTGDWVTTTLGSSNPFYGIAYGNGRWVTVSTTGAVYTSIDDGLNWTLATTLPFYFGTSQMLKGTSSFTFQNGRFMFYSAGLGSFAESLDGVSWQILAYPYPTTTGGVDGAALNTLTGMFLSSTLGTPTWTGFGTGITFNASAITQTAQMCGYANVSGGGPTNSTILMGPGNWHEVQVIMRPTTTAEQWSITYGIDDWVSTPVVLTYSGSTSQYPWFNLSRRAAVSNFGNLVFYEIEGSGDSFSVMGPDIRIYTERPSVDEQAQWNRTGGTTSNAQAIATGTVTNATTNISEQGLNKTDQYRVSTTMPSTVKVLSVQSETYFSRMLPNTTYVSVGSEVEGQDIDTPAVQVSSPVNSWAYVTQRMDKNPVSGSNWTYATASGARMRVTRASNDPVTVALIHCDGLQGATTVPYAINVGGGMNRAVNSAVITTSDSKFGGSCIQIPSGSAWNFTGAFGGPGNNLGLNDFTIEFWIKTSATGTANAVSMDTNLYGSNYGGILLTPNGIYMSNAGTAWDLAARPAGTFNNNAWRHVAICRLGSSFYLWVDGQPTTNSPSLNASAISVRGNAGILTFGAPSGNLFAGLIDEIRVSRGCRYTTAFTPPTGPFTS